MAVLFLSYRRVDTAPWAGRLYDALARKLTRAQLFMDIDGRIVRGDRFAETIEAALGGCDALLALIGPDWATCTRDGLRRLDHPDDWVRHEIATTFARGRRVVPVLCGGAPLPDLATLPEPLRPLVSCLAATLTEERWEDDVDALVADLLARVPGLADAGTGVAPIVDAFVVLARLADDLPAVATALAESRAVLADLARQIGEVQVYKELHEALHCVELECLEPLTRPEGLARVRVYATRLETLHARIDGILREAELDVGLVDELSVNLEIAVDHARRAVDERSEEARAAVVEALRALVGSLPSTLSARIDTVAGAIRWEDLAPVLARLGAVAAANAPGREDALAPLSAGMAALDAVGRGLLGRVTEHSRLQGLDRQLRPLCLAPGTLAGMRVGWTRVQRLRALLTPPRSAPVELVWVGLDHLGAEVDAALAAGDLDRAREATHAWFDTVRFAFREVDRLLLEECARLATLSAPLRTLISPP